MPLPGRYPESILYTFFLFSFFFLGGGGVGVGVGVTRTQLPFHSNINMTNTLCHKGTRYKVNMGGRSQY